MKDTKQEVRDFQIEIMALGKVLGDFLSGYAQQDHLASMRSLFEANEYVEAMHLYRALDAELSADTRRVVNIISDRIDGCIKSIIALY